MSHCYSICKFRDVITHKQGYCKLQQWGRHGFRFHTDSFHSPLGFTALSCVFDSSQPIAKSWFLLRGFCNMGTSWVGQTLKHGPAHF